MAGNEFATDDEIILLYPHLSIPPPEGLDIGTRDMIRECAECEFNECIWGCALKMGHLHYAAFLMEVNVDQARKFFSPSVAPQATGPLASVTEGPQAVSYHAPQAMSDPSDQFLQTKRSGQQYLHLREGLGPVPVLLDNIGCEVGANWKPCC